LKRSIKTDLNIGFDPKASTTPTDPVSAWLLYVP